MSIVKVFFAGIFILFACGVRSQTGPMDTAISVSMIGAHIGIQVPGFDLAKRFGHNGAVGGSFMFKDKHNFLYGASGTFIFGNQLREDTIFDNLITESGGIINKAGNFAELSLFERGYYIMGHFGKVFNVVGPNENSGLELLGGVGFLEHKIRIQDEFDGVPQLAGNYKKGYDRLTNGLSLSQYIGYRHFSNTRLINYYVGIEIVEAFTQNRRSVNFDTMAPDKSKRFDLLVGLKFGWVFPIYKRKPRDFYFY